MRIGTVSLIVALFVLATSSQGAAAPLDRAAGKGAASKGAATSSARRALDSYRLKRSRTPGQATAPGLSGAKPKSRPSQAQPQSGTGRLGRETLPRAAKRRNSRAGNAWGRLKSKRRATGNRRNPQLADSTNSSAGRTRVERLKWEPATKAEYLLNKRLARIDRLRDIALENGNDNLLERADTLEALARRQYDRRIELISAEEQAENENRPESRRIAPGRFTSKQARAGGRAYGELTSEEARKLRREFGRTTSRRARGLETPSDVIVSEEPAGTATVSE